MRHRSYSFLRKSLITLVGVLALQVAPGTLGWQSAVTAIIELKPGTDPQSITGKYGVTLVDSIPELSKYLIQGNSSSLTAIGKDHNVASVEYNAEADISERAMVNESTVALLDPDTVALLDDQDVIWDGHNWIKASVLTQPALQKIGFTLSTAPTAPVTVAVIDTGIDPKHEMLLGSTLPGRNFINPSVSTDELNDLDPSTAALLQQFHSGITGNIKVPAVLNESTVALLDPATVALMTNLPSLYFGHGTMVSGLIHAVAPNSLIMPLKAFDATGRGTSFRIAQAIVYGVNQGADVLNMSFSLDSASLLIQDALHYASQHNVVLVASIGNNNSNTPKSYPASYANVIGVGATDLNDLKATFSNWGPCSDVAAPGVGLISPYPAGLYAVWSGTSASAALVSGEAALLISQLNLKANDTTTRIGDRSDHVHFNYPLGKGRINLKNALKK